MIAYFFRSRKNWHLSFAWLCRHLQDTLGNSTGFTYQTIIINYVDMFNALQTKLVDFLYSYAGSTSCAIAEAPGLAVLVDAGIHYGPAQYWHDSGVIIALKSSKITQVWFASGHALFTGRVTQDATNPGVYMPLDLARRMKSVLPKGFKILYLKTGAPSYLVNISRAKMGSNV